MSPDPQQIPDSGGWSSMAAVIAAIGTAATALFKSRGHKAEVVRLGNRIHDTDDKLNAAQMRIAVVESTARDITSRLDRIEDKLDRLLEHPR